MIVTHKIKIELLRPGISPTVSVMQADENSRVLEITLNANGSAWEIPDGVSFSIAYKKPDGTKGLYDTLPNGSNAFTVAGNTVSVVIAPQMLTVPGTVTASVVISDGEHRVNTFPIIVNVIQNPAVGAVESEDYYYSSVIGNLEDLKTENKSSLVAAVNEIFSTGGSGSDSGQNVELDTTLTQSGKAADAKAVGDALDELEEKIPSIEGLAKSEDIPKVPNWAMQASKPTYSKSEVGLGNVDNVKQYSASNPPPYPVTSVNGKTGAVTLDAAAVGARPSSWMPSASDVGALPASTTIPTKVSQLTNDAGYLTKHQDISGKVDKDKLTLGRDASGLLYLYIDGLPAGAGIELPTGGIDGYITEDKQIIFNNLPDGEYTLAYIAEDGSIVPIGALEKDTNVYYTVKNTLTNCTSNNSATQAVQGGSYSATITAKSGYELSSVKVTMGGKDVSSAAVSGGTITISNVTGNIVITAVATEIVVVPTYTNLFDPSKAQINKRVSNSYELKDGVGHVTTEFIDIQGKTPFTNSTKFYVKGANFNATSSGSAQARIITYKTIPSTPYSGEYSVITANNMTQTDEGNGVISISGVASSFVEGIKYMVLTLKVSDSTITAADIQNIVVTIDEPIV